MTAKIIVNFNEHDLRELFKARDAYQILIDLGLMADNDEQFMDINDEIKRRV